MLTNAQLQTLKTDILNTPAFNSLPNDGGGNTQIANAYNLAASPAWVAWKMTVGLDEVGSTINGTELAGLTTANSNRLQLFNSYFQGGFRASANIELTFNDVFSGSGGTITRPALQALLRRNATRAEKLFSTGTGTTASPATLGWEGMLTYSDVESARNL